MEDCAIQPRKASRIVTDHCRIENREVARPPLTKSVSVVKKTNKPSESRIDNALNRGSLTVTQRESPRPWTAPLLPEPMAEPDAGDLVQSAMILTQEIVRESGTCVDFDVSRHAYTHAIPDRGTRSASHVPDERCSSPSSREPHRVSFSIVLWLTTTNFTSECQPPSREPVTPTSHASRKGRRPYR
jgi:hypothetical protein